MEDMIVVGNDFFYKAWARQAHTLFYSHFQNRVPSIEEAKSIFGNDALMGIKWCHKNGYTGWMGDTFLVVTSEF